MARISAALSEAISLYCDGTTTDDALFEALDALNDVETKQLWMAVVTLAHRTLH